MPYGEETDPSVLDYVGKGNPEDVNPICSYLKSGVVLITCCGTSEDVINPENGTAGVPSVLTDGKWVWPGDLEYYVRAYRLGLNSAFVNDMRASNWKVSLKESDLNYSVIEIEGHKLLEE